jgi:trigger factor
VRELEEYTFHYKMGLEPEFEVKGVGPETEYVRFDVQISDEMLNEELEILRDKNPRITEPEGDFQEGDTISFKIAELDGDAVKAGGLESSFEAMISQIKDEALRAQVLAAKTGDALQLNMFTAFDVEETVLFKKWLGIAEEDKDDVGELYEAVIEKATRTEPAVFDEEFFHGVFGEDVSTLEEAKDIIRKELRKVYDKAADDILYGSIRKHIPEVTEAPLPEDFLWEWLVHTKEDDTDDIDLQLGFDGFLKGLQWNIIRNKLITAYDIQVTEEQVLERFKTRIKSYFGDSPYFQDDFISQMAGA